MQCSLTFYIFVPSRLFFLEVVVKLFDDFWNPSSLFSKLCVNCLLVFYFVYCNNCALKDVIGACYCTCSLVALCVPELCFWPAKTRKTLNFLRCTHVIDPVLKYGSDKNEGNWLQLLFYFIVLMSIVASVIGMSFFSAMFQVLDWSFLVLTETFAIGFQKWFGHKWIDFGVFCWKMASSVYLLSLWIEICKNCSIVILFWRHRIFLIFSLRGILVCSLKMLVLLSHRIL